MIANREGERCRDVERLEKPGIAVCDPLYQSGGRAELAEAARRHAERTNGVVGPVLAAVEAVESRPAPAPAARLLPDLRESLMTLASPTPTTRDPVSWRERSQNGATGATTREEDIVRAAPRWFSRTSHRFDERDARELQGWDPSVGRERHGSTLIDGTWVP